MRIYISIVTNQKTGIREIAQVSLSKKSAQKFHQLDRKILHIISHTEEWDGERDLTKIQEYITDEDWNR